MDEIKPTAAFGQSNYPAADSTAEAKPSRNFSVITGNESTAAPEKTAASPATAQFNKADLQDPAKLDRMVRSSISEAVDSSASSLPISSADKEALTNFLSEDPLFRQQVESYLRKALP